MKKFVEGINKTPYRLKLNLQTFAEDNDDNPDDDNDDNGGDDKPFATFKTKEDLNKRLERATRKGQKELATSLGFESVEALRAALNKDKDKEEDKQSNKSDDDMDVDSRIEEKLKEEREKTFKRLLAAEVKVQANELGFADWEDAHALADLSEVTEDDKGNLKGVKEALEALAKNKPHLIKSKGSGSFGASVPNSQNRQKASKEDIIKLAQSRGTMVDSQTAYNPWAKN